LIASFGSRAKESSASFLTSTYGRLTQADRNASFVVHYCAVESPNIVTGEAMLRELGVIWMSRCTETRLNIIKTRMTEEQNYTDKYHWDTSANSLGSIEC
jgi:hypothetical protein